MPRKIKGWKFVERHKDAFEEFKALKLYYGIYKKSDVKVLYMVNQYGQPYTDIYLKLRAKPIRKLIGMFGSSMSFKDIKEVVL